MGVSIADDNEEAQAIDLSVNRDETYFVLVRERNAECRRSLKFTNEISSKLMYDKMMTYKATAASGSRTCSKSLLWPRRCPEHGRDRTFRPGAALPNCSNLVMPEDFRTHAELFVNVIKNNTSISNLFSELNLKWYLSMHESLIKPMHTLEQATTFAYQILLLLMVEPGLLSSLFV